MRAKKARHGFTLMEILIVIILMIAIAIGVLFLLNPLQQMYKARDSQRKHELDVLKKTFEVFYNDKGCYPKLAEVCYNAKSNYAPSEAKTCNICGSNASSPSFSPYLEKLPCDYESPKRDYMYQVDDLTCPQWFRIYSQLNNNNDQSINDLGCLAKSCGPKPFFNYNYGVSSPNTNLERSTTIICLTNNGTKCNICGTYDTCQNPIVSWDCQIYKKFYASYSSCCEDNDLCLTNYKCTYNAPPNGCIQCGRSSSECVATGKCATGSIAKGTCP